MKIEKAEKRDKKIAKRRHGMRVHGKSVNLLLRLQEKRDKEKLKNG